jgi:hypothetical protein
MTQARGHPRAARFTAAPSPRRTSGACAPRMQVNYQEVSVVCITIVPDGAIAVMLTPERRVAAGQPAAMPGNGVPWASNCWHLSQRQARSAAVLECSAESRSLPD